VLVDYPRSRVPDQRRCPPSHAGGDTAVRHGYAPSIVYGWCDGARHGPDGVRTLANLALFTFAVGTDGGRGVSAATRKTTCRAHADMGSLPDIPVALYLTDI